MKIYQAYSENLDMWAGHPTTDLFEAQEEADFENRFAVMTDGKPGPQDWKVREGEVHWK